MRCRYVYRSSTVHHKPGSGEIIQPFKVPCECFSFVRSSLQTEGEKFLGRLSTDIEKF